MDAAAYGIQAGNSIVRAGEAFVSYRLMGERQKLAELQESRAQKEFSLREMAFNDQLKKEDRDYALRLDELNFQRSHEDFTRQYQRSQMRMMDVNFNNEQASIYVAPYLAKFQSDLTNLSDPDAVKRFSPDSSFIDSLPEEQRVKANAIWSTGVQTAKNGWLAQTGIVQLNQKKADNLLENAHLIEGVANQSDAMELGYMMKAGGVLPPEYREAYNRYATEIEKKKPLSVIETQAVVSLAKEAGDRYETNLKEMRKAVDDVDTKYKYEDLTNEETKKRYNSDKVAAASPYILSMQKAEKERLDYSSQAIGARGKMGQAEVGGMPQEPEPTPQPAKPRAREVLRPLFPTERRKSDSVEAESTGNSPNEADMPTEAGAQAPAMMVNDSDEVDKILAERGVTKPEIPKNPSANGGTGRKVRTYKDIEDEIQLKITQLENKIEEIKNQKNIKGGSNYEAMRDLAKQIVEEKKKLRKNK